MPDSNSSTAVKASAVKASAVNPSAGNAGAVNAIQVNPYAVPDEGFASVEGADHLPIHIDGGWVTHTLDHYMLRRHPWRLSLLSIALIGLSATLIIGSMRYGGWAVLLAGTISMAGSAAVYHASIVASRRRVRRRLATFGLIPGGSAMLQTGGPDDDFFQLTTDQSHRWPLDALTLYRTSRGTIACPEADVPIFIPRNNPFATRTLTAEILRRLRQASLATPDKAAAIATEAGR